MDGHGKTRDPPCREERGRGTQRPRRNQLDACEKRDELVAPEDLDETNVNRDGKEPSQKEVANMLQKCGTQGAQTVSEDAAPNVSVLLHEPDKLQAMVSEIWSMMKGNECFVDLLERENQALKGQMHQLKAKHLCEVETLKSEIAKQRKCLEDELEKSQSRFAAEMKRLREEHEAQRQLHDTEMLQVQMVDSSLMHVNEHAMKQNGKEAVYSESFCKDAQSARNEQNLHANQPEQALQSADSNLSTKENRESNVAFSNASVRKAANDAEDNDAEDDFSSAASADFLFEGSQRSANSVGPTQDEVIGTPQSRRSTKCSSGPPTQDEVFFSPHRAKRSDMSSPEDVHFANSPASRSAPHLSNSADTSPQSRTNFARGSRCTSPCAPRTPRKEKRERKVSPSSRNSARTPKWSDKPSSKVFSASKPAHRHKPNGRFFSGRSPSQKRRRLRERDQEEEEESLQTSLQNNKESPLVSKNGAQETAAGGALAPGHKFRFVEVVRNKADRAALPGHSCHKCERFYAALRVTDPHALQELRNECSRHRHRYVAPGTPPTFWDIPSLNSFADTQTQDSGTG